jgi:hypothetical protein
MPLKRRYTLFLAVGIFVPALVLGLWIGGAQWGSEQKVSRVGADGFGEPAASFGLRSLPEPERFSEPEPESFDDAEAELLPPRELTRKEQMIADFPMQFDAIPPQIMEDIERIAEAQTPDGVPPELREELEEQLGMAGVMNPNRAVVDMAAQTVLNAQRAYEAYIEADQEVPMPTADELQQMREIRDASVPSPGQWELLGGRPDSVLD